MDVTAEQDGEMDAHIQNDFLLPEAEGTCQKSEQFGFPHCAMSICKINLVPLVHVCVHAASVFETRTVAHGQHHPKSPNKAYRFIMFLFHKGSKFTLRGWKSQ